MSIILDNIIFSLQKSGGVSVVWKEHISRLLDEYKRKTINLRFLEYDNALENIFRKDLNIPHGCIVKESESFLFLKRYLAPCYKCTKQNLFHSSYYRTLKGATNITTVHDFTYEYYYTGLKRKIHSWQKRKAILNSEKIICISNNTRDDVLKFIPEVDSSRLEVVYNGVNEAFRQLSTKEKINGFPFEVGEYILFVGDRQSKYKQFDLTVKVAFSVRKPLAIVGAPLTDEEVVKLSGLRYYILSGVSTSTLNILYNNAFCLLYPSLYEGFGIPIIEAQRAGCPVIAGANSSITEVMGAGSLLLDTVDAPNIIDAINALDNSSCRDEIIQKGLINSERFSWEKTFEKTLNVYKSVM